MDSVTRNVIDLSPDERHVFEGVLGQPLDIGHRVVVQLCGDAKSKRADSDLNAGGSDEKTTPKRDGDVGISPDWCAIFADLSDDEMAELDALILDRSDSRYSDLP
jgi:hypothetical protein